MMIALIAMATNGVIVFAALAQDSLPTATHLT